MPAGWKARYYKQTVTKSADSHSFPIVTCLINTYLYLGRIGMHFTFALGFAVLLLWLVPMAVNLTPMGKPPIFMFSGGPLKVLRIIVSVVTSVALFVNVFDNHLPVIVQNIASCLIVVSLAGWAAVWALCLGEGSYLPLENKMVALVYVFALPAGIFAVALHDGNWLLLALSICLAAVRWLCARPFLATPKIEKTSETPSMEAD